MTFVKSFLLFHVVGPLIRRQAPRVVKALNTPGPERGTMGHALGSLMLAVIAGLIYWFLHAHR